MLKHKYIHEFFIQSKLTVLHSLFIYQPISLQQLLSKVTSFAYLYRTSEVYTLFNPTKAIKSSTAHNITCH